MTLHPDVPGRGAWTRTGGLLPVKYGGHSGPGYYRAAGLGELMVGAVSTFGADASHTAKVVHLGVKALQRLVQADPDGWLGNDTGAAIVRAQRRLGLSEDGIAGPKTLRALLEPLIVSTAKRYGVPVSILGGLAVHESGLDPAAVGVNGWDHGLVQVNLQAHDDVTLEQALDPRYALDFAAKDLRDVHDRWDGKTKADPWEVAVLHHNSPRASVDLATGKPIAEKFTTYVRKVRAAW